MRFSAIAIALSSLIASSSHARPIDAVDGVVSQVDIPDAVQYIDCDPKDPTCGESTRDASLLPVHTESHRAGPVVHIRSFSSRRQQDRNTLSGRCDGSLGTAI